MATIRNREEETVTAIDPIHLTSSSEQYWMRHFGGQCQRVLFSEVRILGDAATHVHLLSAKMVSVEQSPRVARVQGVNKSKMVIMVLHKWLPCIFLAKTTLFCEP